MRKAVQDRDGGRVKVTGTFERQGIINGRYGPVKTLSITDIRDEAGSVLTDQYWFRKGRSWPEMSKNDVVSFMVRLQRQGDDGQNQMTGERRSRQNYLKLVRPTKISVVK